MALGGHIVFVSTKAVEARVIPGGASAAGYVNGVDYTLP
jgi:hypothetical protein